MEAFGIGLLGLVLSIVLIILVIMALLMPFAVWRIRNEMIELNEKVKRIIDLMPSER